MENPPGSPVKLAAVLALVLSSLACAGSSSSPGRPTLSNGRCTCDSGALCLVAAGAPVQSAVCAPPATAGLGCASFTNASRSCWGSPTAGLCLCSGDASQLATAAK